MSSKSFCALFFVLVFSLSIQWQRNRKSPARPPSIEKILFFSTKCGILILTKVFLCVIKGARLWQLLFLR